MGGFAQRELKQCPVMLCVEGSLPKVPRTQTLHSGGWLERGGTEGGRDGSSCWWVEDRVPLEERRVDARKMVGDVMGWMSSGCL